MSPVGRRRFRAAGVAALIILLCLAGAAPAQPPYRHHAAHWARAAMLVTVAPACGLRDADWARRLEARVAAAQRVDLTPEAQRDGLAAAAFAKAAGTFLLERFGRAVCNPDGEPLPWRDAAGLPADDGRGEGLPALPDPVLRLGWQAVIGTVALHCQSRDQAWASDAGRALRRGIVTAEGLVGDQPARRGIAAAIVDLAGAIAVRLPMAPGLRACDGLRRDRDLLALDEQVGLWRRQCEGRRPHPSCATGF